MPGAKSDEEKNVICLKELCTTLILDLLATTVATLMNEESVTVCKLVVTVEVGIDIHGNIPVKQAIVARYSINSQP